MLTVIINDSSRHRKAAALLSSKALLMRQRLAYQLADINQVLELASQALLFAHESQNETMIISALRELASVYEWPMKYMRVHERRKRALELTDEAVSILTKPHTPIEAQVQSWVFISHAKFQAFNGLKQEAYESIGRAWEVFAPPTGNVLPRSIRLTETNLIRQEGIVHSYLGQAEQSMGNFLRLIDENSKDLAAKMSMNTRTHLSLLSEATFSSLKLPHDKKDKDLSKKLWKVELQFANKLHSTVYRDEAKIAYRIMEAVWPEDPEIRDFRDLIEE
jgi:hypothetical protein